MTKNSPNGIELAPTQVAERHRSGWSWFSGGTHLLAGIATPNWSNPMFDAIQNRLMNGTLSKSRSFSKSIKSSLVSRMAIVVGLFVLGGNVGANATALILKQPISVTVHPDDTARFRISAVQGATYQWYRNGQGIVGAQDSLLVIPTVSLSDDGAKFACRIQVAGDVQTSQDVVLGVVRHTRQLVTITGSLANSTGTQVGSSGRAVVDIQVDLFSVLTGGESQYRERFAIAEGHGVGVENGLFTLRLGEGRLDSLSGELHQVVGGNRNLYVQFTIGSGAATEVLQPRLPFTAMPYAISGNSAVLKGVVDPNLAGLVAPIGSMYVNTKDNSTWIRTARAWVSAN